MISKKNVQITAIELAMKTSYPWTSGLSDPTSAEFKHAQVDIGASVRCIYRYLRVSIIYLSLSVIWTFFFDIIERYYQ
jgi:ABC-type amino acid transport system permease subunit